MNLQSGKYFPYPDHYKFNNSPYYLLDIDDKHKINYVNNLQKLEEKIKYLLNKYNKKSVYDLFNDDNTNKEFWNFIGTEPIKTSVLNIMYPVAGTAPVVISPYAKDIPSPDDEFHVLNPKQIDSIFKNDPKYNEWSGIKNNNLTSELIAILENIFPFELFRVDNQPEFYTKSDEAKSPSYQISTHDICFKRQDHQNITYNGPIQDTINNAINDIMQKHPGERSYLTTSVGVISMDPSMQDGHAVSFRLNINEDGEVDRIDFNNSNSAFGLGHIDAYCIPFLVAIKDRLSENFQNKLDNFIEKKNHFLTLKNKTKDEKILKQELENVFNAFDNLSPCITDLNIKTQSASTCIAHSFIICKDGVVKFNGDISQNKNSYLEKDYPEIIKNLPSFFRSDGTSKPQLERETFCYNTLVSFFRNRINSNISNIKQYVQRFNNLHDLQKAFCSSVEKLQKAIQLVSDKDKKNILRNIKIAFPNSIAINNSDIEFNQKYLQPDSAYAISKDLEKIDSFLKTQRKIGDNVQINTYGLKNWCEKIAVKSIIHNSNLANINSSKNKINHNVKNNLNNDQKPSKYKNNNIDIKVNATQNLNNNTNKSDKYNNNSLLKINSYNKNNLSNNRNAKLNYNKTQSTTPVKKATIEVPKGIGSDNFVFNSKGVICS